MQNNQQGTHSVNSVSIADSSHYSCSSAAVWACTIQTPLHTKPDSGPRRQIPAARMPRFTEVTPPVARVTRRSPKDRCTAQRRQLISIPPGIEPGAVDSERIVNQRRSRARKTRGKIAGNHDIDGVCRREAMIRTGKGQWRAPRPLASAASVLTMR
jgi:hypothetical protein